MRFIDVAKIRVQAGHGGKGCVSFRREKYVPRGGPDGGNGGKGGDVVLTVDASMSTLMDLQYKKNFEAGNGDMGKGANKDGRGGTDRVIHIPPGTDIYDDETGEKLLELTEPGQTVIIAKGGRGGRGNAFFATSTHQAPRYSQDGEVGEEKNLRLELKLLADVGLIGQPNAGKSTLLSVISKARPKIADYPFTTLTPGLGVVSHKNYQAFTVADIPGLIEGSHTGAGLGIRFLKHIERTRVFLHLVSLGPDAVGTPLTRFLKIQKELKTYNPDFAKRPLVIVLTKTDLIHGAKELKEIEGKFKKKGCPVFTISSATGKGISELLDTVVKILKVEKI